VLGKLVLPMKAMGSSGVYVAVIACAPTLSVGMAMLAWPATRVLAELSGVASSLNCTLPVGVVAGGVVSLTVAVSTTDWPQTAVAGEGVTLVVVVSAAEAADAPMARLVPTAAEAVSARAMKTMPKHAFPHSNCAPPH
jgi:hypothetical protein